MRWRKMLLFFCLLTGFLVILLFFLSLLYSNYYGRMRDDEALNTFQISLPVMPKGTIPLGGGRESLRKSDPDKLINPLPITKAVIEQGRKSYNYFCVQCHGPGLDGKATVGQSFYPLPTDLLDPQVKAQTDGKLFFKISLGYKRQPPLYATIATEDLWAVINYLRAMAQNKDLERASQ
ncbi:MAG: c-type cytochrome [Thermodesulfobacteriota bacterium]|jgi:cytochrome c5